MWRWCWDSCWVCGRGKWRLSHPSWNRRGSRHEGRTIVQWGLWQYLIHWPNLYDWCGCGDPCQVNGRGKSHPPGTGGAPSIHDIYLSYILYYLAINHYQLNTMMIMPTPSQCTGCTEVQLRQISPTCHVIITSQDALNIKSQTGDGPNLPIYPFFWTELWNFYRQKSSYSIRSRQPEIIKILRPPKRILSSFPSHPKTTEEHPRHTHARSNAVTCVSMSVCNASVLRSRQHLGRGKWRLPHPPWYAGAPRMIIVSQIKHLKWDIEPKTKV